MKMMRYTPIGLQKGLLLFLSVFALSSLQGCADLEEVNAASSTALETIKSYSDINYTFAESYRKYIVPRAIFNGVDASPVVGIPDIKYDYNELNESLKADKVTSLFFSSLQSYFEGLTKLSDKEFGKTDFSKLSDEIKNEGVSSKLGGITPAQIDAASKIAKVLADNLLHSYKENQVRNIIIKYDADVSKTITGAIKCLDFLCNNIDTDLGFLDTKFTLILANPSIDKATKLELLNKFESQSAELQDKKAAFRKLQQGLLKIKEAHNQLAKQLANSKLTTDNAKKILKQYVGDAKIIYTQIQILNENKNK